MRFTQFHNRYHKCLVMMPELITAFGEMRTLLASIGIDVEMYCGWRGEAEQNEALAKGFSKAKFGSSPHNYGAAFDCAPVDSRGQVYWPPTDDPVWTKIGMAGEKYGLEWGGTFKSITDMPHFQIRGWADKHFELFHTEPPIG